MATAADLLDRLNSAFERFRRLNVELNRGRYAFYRAVLERDAAARSEDERPPVRDLYAAVCETEDLTEAAELPDDVLAGHELLLRRITLGEPVYADAGQDDPGRQALFPLVAARQFFVAGLHVALEAPSDVVLRGSGGVLLMECKRVNGDQGLARRLREAYRQLSVHRRAGQTGFGVVAVELSRAVNPNFDMIRADTRRDGGDILQVLVERAFRRCSTLLANELRQVRSDAEVDLVLFRIQAMVQSNDEPQSCVAEWRAVPTGGPAERVQALHALLERLPGFQPGVFVVNPRHV